MTILDLVKNNPGKKGTLTCEGEPVFYGYFEDIPLKYAEKTVLEFTAPGGEIIYKISEEEAAETKNERKN